MATPTENAQELFELSKGPMRGMLHDATNANKDWFALASTMINVINGLQAMTIAQRATYIKLEELERKINALTVKR